MRAPRLACRERTRTWGTGQKKISDFNGSWAVGAVPAGLGGIVQLTRHLRAGLSHSVPAALGQRSMMKLGDPSKVARQASTWTVRRGQTGCLLSPGAFRRGGVTPKSATAAEAALE